MAYLNRQFAQPTAAYPELHPVTPRHFKSQPLRSHQRKHTTRGELLLYCAVNAALIFGVIQCARTLIGDSLNLSLLMNSLTSVQQAYQQTHHENKLLQDKIRLYSSPSGIEELARNYLNMVGENELPIRFQ